MKKGFLFVLTIFLILTYILISISIWVKAVDESERTYSEFYKESNVELTLAQITDEKVKVVSNITMNRALFRINQHSIDNPVKEGPAGDRTYYFKSAMESMLRSGTADSSNFEGASALVTDGSSMESWKNALNASLASIGVSVSNFSISEFQIEQKGIDSIEYKYKMALTLSDNGQTTKISKNFEITDNIQIVGLVDPAIARSAKASGKLAAGSTVYRQFFFNSQRPTTSEVKVNEIKSGTEGQGWKYGYLVSPADVAKVDTGSKANTIIVGNYSDIIALTPAVYDNFGGFILTNEPTKEAASGVCSGKSSQSDTFNPIKYTVVGAECQAQIGTEKTDKPFLVSPGFTISMAPDCPVLESENVTQLAKCALIISSVDPGYTDGAAKLKTPSTIYDMETLRDQALCGYYVQDSLAPSYLDRLFKDPYSKADGNFGIETFVIGEYSKSFNLRSRVDRKIFTDVTDQPKIRGMPGCKDKGMCSDDPDTGIFALDPTTSAKYSGVNAVSCKNDGSSSGC